MSFMSIHTRIHPIVTTHRFSQFLLSEIFSAQFTPRRGRIFSPQKFKESGKCKWVRYAMLLLYRANVRIYSDQHRAPKSDTKKAEVRVERLYWIATRSSRR